MSKHACEEPLKLSRLEIEKPYVFGKMQQFDAKIARGESIAIIRIEYRYECNFRCEHCCIEPFQRQTGRQLTLADVASISRQADELGLARFVITGGEPLIFKDFDAVVAAIDPRKHYINVDTNGWHLDLARAKHLKAIGVDRIQLSIDNMDAAAHDAFRNALNSHVKALRSADLCQDVGLDVFVQTVVTKKRLYSDEFIRFMDHFNRRGIGVFVTFLKPVGAAEGMRDEMCGKEDFAYFKELERKHNVFWHLTNAYGRDVGCIAVKGMVSITAFGDVLPCPYWFEPLGNVFHEPLKDIIERGMKMEPFSRYIDTCPVADKDWGKL